MSVTIVTQTAVRPDSAEAFARWQGETSTIITAFPGFIEQRLQPVVRPLGFRTAEFAWSRYAQWVANARGMELAERRLVPPLGHFSLVRFRKIEVKELPPAPGPFAILAKDQRAETQHATLQGAVKAAQSGDTIEIRGNGPFVVAEAINLGYMVARDLKKPSANPADPPPSDGADPDRPHAHARNGARSERRVADG